MITEYEVVWAGRGSLPGATEWPHMRRNAMLDAGYNPGELPSQEEMRGKCQMKHPWGGAIKKQRSRKGVPTKRIK